MLFHTEFIFVKEEWPKSYLLHLRFHATFSLSLLQSYLIVCRFSASLDLWADIQGSANHSCQVTYVAKGESTSFKIVGEKCSIHIKKKVIRVLFLLGESAVLTERDPAENTLTNIQFLLSHVKYLCPSVVDKTIYYFTDL